MTTANFDTPYRNTADPTITSAILGVNYVGPYVSGGSFQTSVEFGKAPPLGVIDVLARLHDSAYAHWSDPSHRKAADSILHSQAEKYGITGRMIGDAVLYGNQTIGSLSNLIDKTLTYGPAGFIYGAVENMLELHDYMLHENDYRKEILDYFKTDPNKELQSYPMRQKDIEVNIEPSKVYDSVGFRSGKINRSNNRVNDYDSVHVKPQAKVYLGQQNVDYMPTIGRRRRKKKRNGKE